MSQLTTTEILHDLASPLMVVSWTLQQLALECRQAGSTIMVGTVTKSLYPCLESIEYMSSLLKSWATLDHQNHSTDLTYLPSPPSTVLVADAPAQTLRQVIQKVQLLCTPQLEKQHVEVVVTLDPSLQTSFLSHPKLWQEVLLNLVQNSLESLMMSRQKKKKIIISAKQMQGHLCLKITDNGGGIADDIFPALLHHRVSSKAGPAHGHGLHIVKKIVEQQLEGELLIETRLEESTIFEIIVSLPSLK
jgi:signal transduction histidine kinase